MNAPPPASGPAIKRNRIDIYFEVLFTIISVVFFFGYFTIIKMSQDNKGGYEFENSLLGSVFVWKRLGRER